MNGTDLNINRKVGSPLKAKDFVETFIYTIVLAALMVAIAALLGFEL